MPRSTSFRLLTLFLLQQLVGYSSGQFDSSSLPVFPTTTSVSTARDVIPSPGERSRECHLTVPGCACFRAIADDNYTLTVTTGDDLITGETISNSSSRPSASPRPWKCIPLFSFELQSAISGVASAVELSLYFGIGNENSSQQHASSDSNFTQVLCRLPKVRHLVVRGLNDHDILAYDLMKPIVECFGDLEDLTVRQASIANVPKVVSRWFDYQHLTSGESIRDTSPNERKPNPRRLVRLDLSDNKIQSFDIELATLSFTELEVLDLSVNQLTKLTKINCLAENISELTNSKTMGSGPQLDGHHNNLEHHGTVEIEAGNGSCIWSEMSDEFTATLWSLNASRNRINSIETGLFNFRYRNLIVLDLSYNSLMSLVNGTFSDLYSLRTVNLSYNNIADIDTEAFTTSTLLTGSDNDTIGSRLDPRGGGKSADREEQYYIRLASCTSGWLDIQVVDLSHNRLTSLREGALELALCAVRHLLLSHNRLDRLPRYVFEHLPYLQTLDLSNNQLAWLDVGAFTNPSLELLDLSGNRLRKIVSMTFLYLPAIRRIDLAHNEISYVYKFAFYRMCSPNDEGSITLAAGTASKSATRGSGAGRRLAIVLHSNRLGSDAIWKMLTTFEHLESPGCLVDVDLGNNQIDRFLPPEPLDFVLKRLEEAAMMSDSSLALSTAMQHFRRWDHVTIDLADNVLRCDCALVNELNAVNDVIHFVTNVSSSTSAAQEVVTTSWYRLNCSSPEEFRGRTVLEFVDMSPTRCHQTTATLEAKLCSGYCACVKNVVDFVNNNGSIVAMNCSGRHLAEFKLLASSSSSLGVFRHVHTLDLSKNLLIRIDPELLRRWFPALRVLYLHENKLASLPPVDGLYGRLPMLATLAGNPLSCTVCDSSMPIAVTNRYNIVDWNSVTCSDYRRPLFLTSSGRACALPLKSSRTVSSRPILSPAIDDSTVVPRVMLTVGLTLAIVLVTLLFVTLIGLVTWSAEGRSWTRSARFRHRDRDGSCGTGWFRLSGSCVTPARVGEVRLDQTDSNGMHTSGVSVDDVFISGCEGEQELFITYCGADSEWVASHLLPVVRRCRASFGTVRLQSFDGRIEVESRQFLGDFRQNLEECCIAVVVLSHHFVEAIVDRGQSKPPEVLQMLDRHCRNTAGRCVFVIIESDRSVEDQEQSCPLGLVHGLTTGSGSTSCLMFAATDDGGRSFSERLRYHLLLQKRQWPNQEQSRRTNFSVTSSWHLFADAASGMRRWWKSRVRCDISRDDSRTAVVDANEKLMCSSTVSERY